VSVHPALYREESFVCIRTSEKVSSTMVFIKPSLLVLFLVVCEISAQESRIINDSPRNRPPVLVQGGDLRNFEIFEDTPVGSTVYTLVGQDPEGSKIFYTISGDYFSADLNTGVVTLKKPLDRETIPKIDVVITIQDESIREIPENLIPFRRAVKVLDRNDNIPEFSDQPYSFTVKETESVGQTVYTDIKVKDADTGPNAQVKLTCIEEESSPDACETFDIFESPLNPGEYIGLVVLKKPLNYEERSSYNLVVQAQDSGDDQILSSTANVLIQVEDIQDQDPVFLNAPYSATVPEGSQEGSPIFEILVRDGDTGIPRPIQLTIEGDRLEYFQLIQNQVSSDGVLSVTLATSQNIIDREHPEVLKEGGLYAFLVRAREVIDELGPVYGEETTTSVTIVVTDIDDELPVFNRNSFTVPVPEDVGSDTPLPGLTLEVVDKDVSKNAEFSLSLEAVSPNSEGVFYVYPERALGKTPVIIRVKDPERLDYENEAARNFQFNVIAEAVNGMQIKSEITVVVTDSNDNIPEFAEKSYEFNVAEDAEAELPIGKIEAFDPDSGSYGEVLYSIKGFGSEKFHVRPETGDISVASCGSENEIIPRGASCLDYEDRKSFSLTYTATDGGGQTTTTNLVIRIEDVNDNHPEFGLDEYRRVVREGDSVFEPALFIKATDSDGPLQGGGKVFYTIKSINTDATVFQIDPMSGEITMTKPVRVEDTENGRYDLVIRATDQGKPEPLHGDVKVFIDVGSIRNQKPKFTQPRYDIAIRENAEVESDVIRVEADDPDGKNSDLVYSIHSGSKDNFVINPSSGMITVAPDAVLSIEQNGELYQIEVQATDNGEPYQQTSTAQVTITVQDVNNKAPKFLQDSYTEYVLENEEKGHHVLTVTATDPDRNADLEYDIIEPIQARDKSGTKLENIAAYDFKAAFSIDPRNGKISISEKLSYSSAAVIILTLQVRDKNAEENIDDQIDTAEATLYIKSFNADNPVFPPPWTPSDPTIILNITENIPPGEAFFNLGAKDPISGQQISNYQKLNAESPLGDLIQISQYGEVISQQVLDFEQIKTISFSVSAIAGEPGQERISEAHLTLQLIDVNDNAPVFSQDGYSAQLNESVLPFTEVVTVQATDADTGDFGRVSYSLQGEGVNEFMIDETTGVITVKPGSLGRSNLDREWVESYNLRVIARDMPGGGSDQKSSTVIVKVTLLDANDSPPQFSQSRYTAVVPENSPTDTQVAQVSATDPDSIDNIVEYDFSNPSQINGLYKIDKKQGIISTNGILTGKGRKEPYVISIRALDNGTPQQFMDTELYITVGDVSRNDGVPKFLKPDSGQIAEVPEESSVGTAVFQAEAMDPDDPNTANGKLVYSFPDDGTIVRKLFQIDANSGLITTKVALDREEREEYTLILEARDLGNPVQQTSRLLTVVVKDVDDHPPQFERQRNSVPLMMEVEEEMPINMKIGEVIAIDKDIGRNAIIDYAIIYGNDDGVFGISRDDQNRGIITLDKRLDREMMGLHTLTIKCFEPTDRVHKTSKKPYDRLKLDEVQVKVHVLDKDDNNPTFVERNMTRGVRVNAAIYTEIGKVFAEDADAEADVIKYHLENVTFHRPKTGMRRELGESGFLVDESTGVIQTNQSYGKYADGFFDVVVKASNSPDPTKTDFAFLKIFVLQDTDLMKFVFDKNPVNVAKEMKEFKKDIEGAFAQPLTLNVYDNEFYSKVDGSLDFGRTSSCFQVLNAEDVVDLDNVQKLFNKRKNKKLEDLFEKYSVDSVERCARVRTPPKINWIQFCILIIAVFIGMSAFIASIVVCCLYSKYKRRIRRSNIKIVEAPVRALIPASLPPGSVMGPAPSLMGQQNPSINGSNGRIYEWQETAMPIDTASYRSLPR